MKEPTLKDIYDQVTFGSVFIILTITVFALYFALNLDQNNKTTLSWKDNINNPSNTEFVTETKFNIKDINIIQFDNIKILLLKWEELWIS